MSVGILGNGEIGSSLHRVYAQSGFTEVAIRDPCQGLDANLASCDLLNVCIPFVSYDQFVSALQELELRDGCVVVIHSTVGFGCTDRLQADLSGLILAHSPVRGVHPSLVDGLLTFEKYVGVSDAFFADESVKALLVQHMRSLKMKPVVCRARESELAKLVSTTLYGMNIAAVTDVSEMCEKSGVDFSTVFTRWQTGYNSGYTSLGKPNVCRPVLTPVPRTAEGDRVIGGHCVLPNCVILEKEHGETSLTQFVLRYSDDKSLSHKKAEDAA